MKLVCNPRTQAAHVVDHYKLETSLGFVISAFNSADINSVPQQEKSLTYSSQLKKVRCPKVKWKLKIVKCE